MRKHLPAHSSARRLDRPLLALATSAFGLSAAFAAQLPQIGLSPVSALVRVEVGEGHHGPGTADFFGHAIAVGDFNQDGYDDLATGIPGNDCDFAVWDCGSVQVRFGWAAGALGGFVTLDPAAAGAPEPAHELDEYGKALAAGDFDGDGYDDLAVGIPANYDASTDGGTGKLGGVQIHYGLHGSLGSIQPVAEHWLRQGQGFVPSLPFVGERFGAALAVGDFDADGHDDLAIGAPKNSFGGATGNVVVAHGGATGLLPFLGYEMRLGMEGLPDAPEAGEDFGYALATGDFNHDGFDDLAIGVPAEDDVGAVLVVYGSPWSLLFANHLYFSQWDLNATTQQGERFGAVLAAGDFDGDGFDDLAVGAPHYDGTNGMPADVGLVAVVHGSAEGLGLARVDWLWEELLRGPGTSNAGDWFGFALAAGDFNADGVDDLAIGTPLDHEPNIDNGAVTVIAGRPGEPLGTSSTWRRLYPAPVPVHVGMIPDENSWLPYYGSSLAAGDFDGNGFSDLAIGAPGRNQEGPPELLDSGAVAVVFGQLFLDGFETLSAGEWSSVAP